jgi:hypothetical protein
LSHRGRNRMDILARKNAEIARLTAALATARNDALDEAADEARRYAGHYQQGSDGRNTFILLSESLEGRLKTTPPAPHKET